MREFKNGDDVLTLSKSKKFIGNNETLDASYYELFCRCGHEWVEKYSGKSYYFCPSCEEKVRVEV